MKQLQLIVLFVLLTSMVKATSQIPDILIFNNDTLELYDSPLLELEKFDSIILKNLYDEVPSNCYRGFIAEWKIIDKSLYLTNIYSPDHSTNINNQIENLLNAKFKKNGIKATWFSGDLWAGKKHINGDYFPWIYETEYYFQLQNSVVLSDNINTLKKCDSFSLQDIETYILKSFSKEISDLKQKEKIYLRLWVKTNNIGEITNVDILNNLNYNNEDKIKAIFEKIPCMNCYYYKGNIWEEGLPIQILLTKEKSIIYFR